VPNFAMANIRQTMDKSVASKIKTTLMTKLGTKMSP